MVATPSIAPVPSRPSAATLARAGLFIVVVLAIATVFVAIVEGAGGADLDGSPIYLVAVVIVATRLRTAAGIVTAVAAFVIYNLLFTEPRYTLTVADPREWLNLVLFLFVALVIGRLAGIGADRAAEAESRAAESEALYGITRILAADGPDVALPAVARSLVADAGMDRVWCTLEDGGGERTVADTGNGPVGPAPPVSTCSMADRGEPAWVRTHGAHPGADRRGPDEGRRTPGVERRLPAGLRTGSEHRYKVRLESDGEPVGALWGTRAADRPEPSHGETRLLALAAAQVGLAVGRERLRQQALAAEVARRDAALKSALVDSVSHDLRTPLAGIRAAAGTLADPEHERTPEEVRATATLIEDETKRLDRMVGGLLDLSRIQAGEIKPDREALDVEDAVRSVLVRMAAGRRAAARRGRHPARPAAGRRRRRVRGPVSRQPRRERRPAHARDGDRVDPGLSARRRRAARRGDRGRGRRAGRRRGGRAAPVRALLPGSRGAARDERDGHRAGDRPRPDRGDGRDGVRGTRVGRRAADPHAAAGDAAAGRGPGAP